MSTTTHLQRGTVAVAMAVLVTVTTATSPAAAKPDPGASRADQTATSSSPHCSLTRMDTQLVRCDNLTGAGASAPWWVPQR